MARVPECEISTWGHLIKVVPAIRNYPLRRLLNMTDPGEVGLIVKPFYRVDSKKQIDWYRNTDGELDLLNR
jgi:hypothetical protein